MLQDGYGVKQSATHRPPPQHAQSVGNANSSVPTFVKPVRTSKGSGHNSPRRVAHKNMAPDTPSSCGSAHSATCCSGDLGEHELSYHNGSGADRKLFKELSGGPARGVVHLGKGCQLEHPRVRHAPKNGLGRAANQAASLKDGAWAPAVAGLPALGQSGPGQARSSEPPRAPEHRDQISVHMAKQSHASNQHPPGATRGPARSKCSCRVSSYQRSDQNKYDDSGLKCRVDSAQMKPIFVDGGGLMHFENLIVLAAARSSQQTEDSLVPDSSGLHQPNERGFLYKSAPELNSANQPIRTPQRVAAVVPERRVCSLDSPCIAKPSENTMIVSYSTNMTGDPSVMQARNHTPCGGYQPGLNNDDIRNLGFPYLLCDAPELAEQSKPSHDEKNGIPGNCGEVDTKRHPLVHPTMCTNGQGGSQVYLCNKGASSKAQEMDRPAECVGLSCRHQDTKEESIGISEALQPKVERVCDVSESLSPKSTAETSVSERSVAEEGVSKRSRRRKKGKKPKTRMLPSGIPGADFEPEGLANGHITSCQDDSGSSKVNNNMIAHSDSMAGGKTSSRGQGDRYQDLGRSNSFRLDSMSSPSQVIPATEEKAPAVISAISQNIRSFSPVQSDYQEVQKAVSSQISGNNFGQKWNTLTRHPLPQSVKEAVDELCSNKISGQGVRYWERGITNLGNTCFVGSALQLLLGSHHFCWLLNRLAVVCECLNPHKLPTLVGLGELAKGLTPRMPGSTRHQQMNSGHCAGHHSQSLMPTMLRPVVKRFQQRQATSGNGGLPEEQDAQEFLLYLLEQIESELLKLTASRLGGDGNDGHFSGPCEQEDDGWEVAGRKNKSSVKRTAGSQTDSLLAAIFGGSVCSIVKAAGMKPSVVSHRFTALDLDIAPTGVGTIEGALQLYTEPDHLSDYMPDNCAQPQQATKVNRLCNLPLVLLLSLKRYTYTAEGLQKIDKRIRFGSTLTIQKRWMVERFAGAEYKLIATCSHHGRGYGGDHYTANVAQPSGWWLNFNDSVFHPLQWNEVARDAPYMMLYERVQPKLGRGV